MHLVSKINMLLIFFFGLLRTFTFLKIISSLSPIVTMLTNVVFDLRIFMLFYTILCILFSLLFCVLGLGNRKIDGNFKDNFGVEALKDAEDPSYPGIEYEVVGLFIGNIIATLRMSLGDFGFDAAIELGKEENIIYWFVWVVVLLVTCIVFLNFIIAEASASYEKVAEFLELYIRSEKAALIQAAEDMIPTFNKTSKKFPKFVIIREKED